MAWNPTREEAKKEAEDRQFDEQEVAFFIRGALGVDRGGRLPKRYDQAYDDGALWFRAQRIRRGEDFR